MSFTPWENRMGTAGFEFIEYAAPDPVAMGKLFEKMGFSAIAKQTAKTSTTAPASAASIVRTLPST